MLPASMLGECWPGYSNVQTTRLSTARFRCKVHCIQALFTWMCVSGHELYAVFHKSTLIYCSWHTYSTIYFNNLIQYKAAITWSPCCWTKAQHEISLILAEMTLLNDDLQDIKKQAVCIRTHLGNNKSELDWQRSHLFSRCLTLRPPIPVWNKYSWEMYQCLGWCFLTHSFWKIAFS